MKLDPAFSPFVQQNTHVYLITTSALSVLLLISNRVFSFVTPAGAQSSGQCETAGVYELQEHVVRNAPQEVGCSSSSN